MANSARDRLRELFLERAVLFGDFTLASGKKSKYYINSKRVLFHAEAITLLGELLYDATKDLVRVPLRARTFAEPRESLQYAWVPAEGPPARGVLSITWATLELTTEWSSK